MKNPFTPVINIVRTFFSQLRTVILSVKDVKEAKRIEKKKKVKVFQLEDNNLIREVAGKLDKNEEFLFIPEQNKVFLPTVRYFTEKLQSVYFTSKNNHYTLDLKDLAELSTLKVAVKKGIKVKQKGEPSELPNVKIPSAKNVKVRWKGKNPEPYRTIEPKGVQAVINLRLGDKWDSTGKTGYSFTLDAHRVLKTKVLEFLEDVARNKILITFVVGGLVGMILMATLFYGMQLYV